MGLKQDIVVKTRFTIRNLPGHGSTPSAFVDKYISRTDATEPLLPAERDQARLEDFITRYISRQQATEQARRGRKDPQEFASKLEAQSVADGRVFGDKSLAYTADQVEDAADQVQLLWNEGHAVQMMVVSFTTDYLKKHGVLPRDLRINERGDLRGQVDELKLRTVISKGVKRMAKQGHYQEPLWTAGVHVNTLQAHVHIVLTDQIALKGSKRIIQHGKYRGQERGVLNQRLCSQLRRSIHHELNDLSMLAPYHEQIDIERQNVVSNVENLVSQQLSNNSKLQQLIASLPKNKRQWRYGSNAKVMQRPNALMDRYLADAITNYSDSLGVGNVLDAIRKYSVIKQQADNLPVASRSELYQNGRQMLVTRMANQIYRILKNTVDDEHLTVTSPYLRHQAQDTDELRSKIRQATINHGSNESEPENMGLTMFTYRLGSYRQRLGHHMEQADQLQTAIKGYDEAAETGNVSPDAFVMRSFYEQEQQYHLQLVDKYRYFLRLRDKRNDAAQERYSARQRDLRTMREELVKHGQQLGIGENKPSERRDNIRRHKAAIIQPLFQDPRLVNVLKLTDEQQRPVKDYLLQTLEQEGQPLPTFAKDVLNAVGSRLPEYQHLGDELKQWTQRRQPSENQNFSEAYWQYMRQLNEVTFDAFGDGLLRANQVVQLPEYREDVTNIMPEMIPTVPEVLSDQERLNPHYFDNIKGLDLHDLMYDIDPTGSRAVTPLAQTAYNDVTRLRLGKLDAANDYLQQTQQVIPALQNLERQLEQQVKYGRDVAKTGQLQFDSELAAQIINPMERNLATLPTSLTGQVAQDYVSSTYDDNKKISERIRRHDQEDLLTLIAPEGPVNDTNDTDLDDENSHEIGVS